VSGALFVVLPGDIDDPGTPSGGNRYDRRVIDQLRLDREVHEIALTGQWPRPGDPALAARLAQLPDGAQVLLDGLVACGVPEQVEPSAGRLRLTVLVHLSLADETGLDAEHVAQLTALERRTLHAATSVITTSQGAARRLMQRHHLPAAKVLVAAPGVDPAPPPAEPRPDGRRLLCVAAVIPRKGQDVLVAALDTLGDLDWECTLVGSTTRDPDFARRIATNSRVRLVGTKAGDELSAAYAGNDLLVLPSRAETYGMVVTEALAHGVPVLGTAVDGVPEALGFAPGGERPGVLVAPDDPRALAAALRDWLTDDALRRRLRTAARSRREALTGWDETARELAKGLQ
jgi:glycosyltransferase involved in cell wall biosynthesis